VAYDESRGVVVAHDGRTVELESSMWMSKTNASAPAPSGAMAHDKGRERILYFGGTLAFARYTDATWSWNGTSWEELVLAAAPPARRNAAMAYDERRRRMVLFGGFGTVSNLQRHLSDTWELKDSTWIQSPAAVAVELRDYPSMTYDQGRQRVVLWGAQKDDDAKVWEYDGTTWIGTEPPPIAGIAGLIVYDAAANRLLLHDGNGRTWARPSVGTPGDTDPRPPEESGDEGDAGDGNGKGSVDGGAAAEDGGTIRADRDSGGCSAAPSSASWAGSWLCIAAMALALRRREHNAKQSSRI
jgi:hypothetical protein